MLKKELSSSSDILEEVAEVLIDRGHIRRRYQYPDPAAVEFCKSVARLAVIVGAVPEIKAVRDPDDGKIIGCAVAAGADYIVTRDKDLLSLGTYERIVMITPEEFLYVVRVQT
jgi:putative PIN family toxin of toxin-antitoxin system